MAYNYCPYFCNSGKICVLCYSCLGQCDSDFVVVVYVYVAVTFQKSLCEIAAVVFMPPTSKKLRGHIGLGLSVQSVSQSVCL